MAYHRVQNELLDIEEGKRMVTFQQKERLETIAAQGAYTVEKESIILIQYIMDNKMNPAYIGDIRRAMDLWHAGFMQDDAVMMQLTRVRKAALKSLCK